MRDLLEHARIQAICNVIIDTECQKFNKNDFRFCYNAEKVNNFFQMVFYRTIEVCFEFEDLNNNDTFVVKTTSKFMIFQKESVSTKLIFNTWNKICCIQISTSLVQCNFAK